MSTANSGFIYCKTCIEGHRVVHETIDKDLLFDKINIRNDLLCKHES
jgi:hypothetical protein